MNTTFEDKLRTLSYKDEVCTSHIRAHSSSPTHPIASAPIRLRRLRGKEPTQTERQRYPARASKEIAAFVAPKKRI